ncbi:MAG: lipopolysaccharide heptosyltransferase II [Pseudomonadota bacterium]
MTKVLPKKPVDRSEISRILIRATNWVGDVVMTIPAIEAVRENFPESTITVLARPWVIPLLEGHPAVDWILPLKKGRGFLSDLVEIIRISVEIRRQRFDLAILFQNAFEAALLAYLGGIRYRVGYNTDGRRLLLSHAVVRDDEILKAHQVEYYLHILRAMGWEARSKAPELFIPGKAVDSIQSLFLSEGIGGGDFLLGMGPGAVFGPAKRWPPERFALIGDWAVERWGAKVLIMGSEGEKRICKEVHQSMRHSPLDLCGLTTLGEVMELIKRCHFFVTNDSGLMHVASALDVPVVAVFGSTDPATTGPRSKKGRIVRHESECAPCLKPECPTDFRCMLSIEPEDVWKQMEILREELM